ncbi:hypothetical protein [Lacipirellula sp.]|uniref:hypothetical protein n=1 Tax=Lacipirellula sp. TaxID=2691419 RepID=UPI003D0E74DB
MAKAAENKPPENAAAKGKIRFKLTHNCRRPGCEGDIDEIVEVTKEDLAYLVERGGGYEVDAAGVAIPVKEEA